MNYSNRLAGETSPYLLQHAHNPVNWFPWGNEAFEIAQKENKLLLISIGYSSCHWCHVMERETFSDKAIADFMNNNYVCVKVDREERPDVDQIYMNAVQIITRRGGWPLNCFALPDGRPVFGGTYFNKENWLNILDSLNTTWKNDKNRVEEVANELSNGIAETDIINIGYKNLDTVKPGTIENYVGKIKRVLDFKNGGTLGAPKFPMPGLIDFLLVYGFHKPDNEILKFVNLTLEKIANGGIYDHIGGGFARYSTDENWDVPHFEKMLYDNAQLISIYSKAYRINPNALYKKVVYETIGFIEQELKSVQGGYYSALDADSGGIEGEFYIWSKSEIEGILGSDAELFCTAYGVSAAGNWNNTNTLRRVASENELKCIFGSSIHHIETILCEAKNKLNRFRLNRTKPALDDKIIVGWNALYISALIEAYITFNENDFLVNAKSLFNYINNYHLDKNRLKRIACKGKVYINGMLDDYALLIQALINLNKVTNDRLALHLAENLSEYVLENLYDSKSDMFFYSPYNSEELIVRKIDLIDGVMPSSNSVMFNNLLQLGVILDKNSYIEMFEKATNHLVEYLNHGSPHVYNWANLALLIVKPRIMLDKIDTGKYKEILKQTVYSNIHVKYSPDKIMHHLDYDEMHICIGNTCQRIVKTPQEISDFINSTRLDSFEEI